MKSFLKYVGCEACMVQLLKKVWNFNVSLLWKVHSDHLICLSVHVVPIVMDFYNAVYCSKAITTNVVVLN